MGLEAAAVHARGVEFEAEAIGPVSAWLVRSEQNGRTCAIIADVELRWVEGLPGVLLDGYWFSDL